MNKILIGCDFSINKPAACIYKDNEYIFIAWPYGFKDDLKELYRENGVTIIDRIDDKIKGDTSSEKMRYQVENARYMSKLIRDSIKPYVNSNTYLGFEGLSYGSTGDVVIQLGGYKYMLMNELMQDMPLDHIFTYSPISIKGIAGCGKRGMTKANMIDSFIENGPECKFKTALKNNELFKTKKAKNWIPLVDDFIDAYFTLKTLEAKEKL